MLLILIVINNIINVLLVACDGMVDPHDMFTVFDDVKKKKGDEVIVAEDNKIVRETVLHSQSAKRNMMSDACLDFLDSIIGAISGQVQFKTVDEDVTIYVGMTLPWSDINTIRKSSVLTDQERLKLCTTLRKSLDRQPINHSRFPLNFLSSIWQWIMNTINSLLYTWKYFYLNVKTFVKISLACTFLSALIVYITVRSLALAIAWILLCVLFVSTYTTYLHMYEVKMHEKEVLLMLNPDGIPRECQRPVKTKIHLFLEYFTGPSPAVVSAECREYLRKINISPDVEIKLSEAFFETCITIFTSFIHSADVAAERISGKYSFVSKYVVYGFIFMTFILVGVVFVSALFGLEVSIFGVRIGSSRHTQHLSIHRQTVVPVESTSLLQGPSAKWVHDFVSLREENLHRVLSQTSQAVDSRDQPRKPESLLKRRTKSHRDVTPLKPILKKLKSVSVIEHVNSHKCHRRRNSL